jgi:hypothetical protein
MVPRLPNFLSVPYNPGPPHLQGAGGGEAAAAPLHGHVHAQRQLRRVPRHRAPAPHARAQAIPQALLPPRRRPLQLPHPPPAGGDGRRQREEARAPGAGVEGHEGGGRRGVGGGGGVAGDVEGEDGQVQGVVLGPGIGCGVLDGELRRRGEGEIVCKERERARRGGAGLSTVGGDTGRVESVHLG